MISSVAIKNFRSIADMELSLGKINVLTGANNSGKSSVIYALLVLKNALENQNQPIDSIFDLGFIDLGGYKEVIYRKSLRDAIHLSLSTAKKGKEIKYGLTIADYGVFSHIDIPEYLLSTRMMLSWPSQSNENIELEAQKFPEGYAFLWNGFTADIVRKRKSEQEPILLQDKNSQQKSNLAREIVDSINKPFEEATSVQNVPIHTGFTRARFSPVSSTGLLNTEAEIATLLYADRELAGIVAFYLKKIVSRQFSVVPVANTTNFYLQTQDEVTGFTADLVNEGLGTNQLVAILTKALYEYADFICIDEPEIHLHPSIIDKLVNVLIDIANERGKQFLISTHSEHFITALLNAVVKERISPEEIKVYHLTKDGWETKAQEQKINEEGQIEGGLAAFYAAELNDWTSFFKTEE